MGSPPLAALALQPQPQPNPMANADRVLQMKSLLQNQQANSQEMQIRQQQLNDQQALTAAMKDADPTSPTFYDDLAKGVLKNGGSATAAMGVQQHALTIKKTVSDIQAQDAATGGKNLDNYINAHKQVGDALEGLVDPKVTPDDQLHDKATSTVNDLLANKILDPATAQKALQGIQNTQDPNALRGFIDQTAKASMGAKAVAEQQKTQAETEASTQKAALDKANAALAGNKADIITQYKQNPTLLTSAIDSIWDPRTPQNARYKFGIQQAMSIGDVDAAKEWIKQASDEKAGLEKESYVQGAENVRQALNRQAMQSNELQRNGLSQLDKLFTDPQHGYTQFLAQAQSTKNAIADAKDGNELAASLAPLMTVLGVNSFAGIHRVNPQEISAAGPGVGSLYRQANTILDKAATGKMNTDTANEMSSVIDRLIEAKHASLIPAAQMVATNSGLDPTKTSVMDRDGKMTTLDAVVKKQAQPAAAATDPNVRNVIGPNGQKQQITVKDGKWVDAKTGAPI